MPRYGEKLNEAVQNLRIKLYVLSFDSVQLLNFTFLGIGMHLMFFRTRFVYSVYESCLQLWPELNRIVIMKAQNCTTKEFNKRLLKWSQFTIKAENL